MNDLAHYTDAELRDELTRRRHRIPDGTVIVDITDELVQELQAQFTARVGSLPMTVACPRCHAPVHQPCRSAGGRPVAHHVDRIAAVGLGHPRTRWYRCPDCGVIVKLASTVLHHRGYPGSYRPSCKRRR
jgi:hypothetical protein